MEEEEEEKEKKKEEEEEVQRSSGELLTRVTRHLTCSGQRHRGADELAVRQAERTRKSRQKRNALRRRRGARLVPGAPPSHSLYIRVNARTRALKSQLRILVRADGLAQVRVRTSHEKLL